MSAHTPGPWLVRGTFQHAVANVDGRAICEAWLRADQDETKANARLIAAAPELLAALSVAAEHLAAARSGDCPSSYWELSDKLREVIAKAEAA